MKNLEKSEEYLGHLEDKKILSAKIEEYRKLLHDFSTPDSTIQKRLEYLEALFRNIIRIEIKNYVEKNSK